MQNSSPVKRSPSNLIPCLSKPALICRPAARSISPAAQAGTPSGSHSADGTPSSPTSPTKASPSPQNAQHTRASALTCVANPQPQPSPGRAQPSASILSWFSGVCCGNTSPRFQAAHARRPAPLQDLHNRARPLHRGSLAVHRSPSRRAPCSFSRPQHNLLPRNQRRRRTRRAVRAMTACCFEGAQLQLCRNCSKGNPASAAEGWFAHSIRRCPNGIYQD